MIEGGIQVNRWLWCVYKEEAERTTTQQKTTSRVVVTSKARVKFREAVRKRANNPKWGRIRRRVRSEKRLANTRGEAGDQQQVTKAEE